MSSTYSTNLALELIGTGDQAGTWGNTTNTNLGTLIEQAISGYVTQAVSTGTDTTITIPNGATGVARNMYIELTGTGGASTNLIVPANKKLYFIFNNASGAVTVKVSGQTGVSVPAGKKVVLASNGTDTVNALNYIADFGSNSATITNLLSTSLAVSSIATFAAGTVAAPSITTTGDTNTGIFFPAADTIAFTEGGVEAARFDSSGRFGIGTEANALTNVLTLYRIGSTQSAMAAGNSNTGLNGTLFGVDTTGNGIINQTQVLPLIFSTSNTERMRLESGGNLAFSSTAQRITADMSNATVSNRFAFQTSTTNGNTQVNAIPNGTSTASQFIAYNNADPNNASSIQLAALSTTTRLLAGQTGTGSYLPLTFFTNGSEQARLDTSGNLGIGTTSPITRLDVSSSFGSTPGYANTTLSLGSSATAGVGVGPSLVFYGQTNNPTPTYAFAGLQGVKETSSAGNYAGALLFLTQNSGGSATLDERARITSGGLFQVTATGSNNTFTNGGQISLKSSDSAPYISWHESTGARIGYLQMSAGGNTNLWVEANQPLVFATNNNERARITSGGFFKASNAGTYEGSTSSYHELRTSTSDEFIGRFTNTASSLPYGFYLKYTNASPNNSTTSIFLTCNDSTTVRAEIRSNGGLANYQSNNADLSDARTKKDVNPIASMWNKIGELEIVTYKYNDQTHDDVNVGVIAQQVESVEPVWVDSDGFGETPEDGVPLKTVYTKDITFAAIKALQEAMARIEQLEAKVAALESK